MGRSGEVNFTKVAGGTGLMRMYLYRASVYYTAVQGLDLYMRLYILSKSGFEIFPFKA